MLLLIADIKYFAPTIEDIEILEKLGVKGGAVMNAPRTPHVNFGDGQLFSTMLEPNKPDNQWLKGKWYYNVLMDMFLMCEEAYSSVKDLINIDAKIKLHIASRVIGEGIIKDFVFAS